MQVNVVDVSNLNTHTAKNGRQYQSIEIMYKNDQGQAQSKKLMSFANPAVFKAAQDWAKGDVVHVSTEKDANGYWQWTAVGGADEVSDTRSDSAPAAQGNASTAKTRVTGSNYETKEERAARQVMIVRQSSLSNAVATLAIEGSQASANDVISLAKLFEGYVLDEESSGNKSFDTLANDIPF
tara:strand:+ start:536 stop:1081 length:546 start_codon:yes stop_codon:yes gene_type:complete